MEFCQIKYQSPATKTYLGSPSILRLSNGSLLATHDYFGPCCPRNHEHEEHLTSVYRSVDDGRTWANVTHLANQYWSSLFEHQGAIYIFGTSQQYGSIVIRRSEDNGNTWTYPRDEKSGLIDRGGFYHDPPNYHCAPVPVLKANGRLHRAFEDCNPCVWGTGFQSLVISIDENADLLVAANWTVSNKLPFNPEWVPREWGRVPTPGWLEGNVVETPEGKLVNILRFNSAPVVDKAAVCEVSPDGRQVAFDPACGFIDFPGGMTKFTIRRDPETRLYFTLSNNNTDPQRANQRNVLSLHVSEDLRNWRHLETLLEDDLDHSWEDSVRTTGFQYVDWQFDGADLIYMVRTAYDGAHNFHDANRMIYGKVEQFRNLLKARGRSG